MYVKADNGWSTATRTDQSFYLTDNLPATKGDIRKLTQSMIEIKEMMTRFFGEEVNLECEEDEKIDLMIRVANMVGVDLHEAFRGK